MGSGRGHHVAESFDTIDHGHLREFLKRRVRDGVIAATDRQMAQRRRARGGVLTTPEEGTPQGGVITPPTMLRTTLLGASLQKGRD